MSEDRLTRLLREADARASTPRVPDNLAETARLRLKRRHARTVGGLSAAAAAVVLGIGCWLLQPYSKMQQETSVPGVVIVEPNGIDSNSEAREAAELLYAGARAEIEQLNREADFQIALVGSLRRSDAETQRRLAFDRRIRYEERNLLPDAVANVRRQADEAAYVVVAHADRMCRELHQCDSAAERYRWVTECFPESCWATVARQRLDELKSKGEIS